MTNSEKAVTWGLIGLIAYELWQRSAPVTNLQGGFMSYASEQSPQWIQQLSSALVQESGGTQNYFRTYASSPFCQTQMPVVSGPVSTGFAVGDWGWLGY